MKFFKHLFLTFVFLFQVWYANAQTFDIKNFGAIGDGKTLNTKAVQKAVDACNQNGGGTVIVPTGIFIIGTVYLKSNVHLLLEPGSILRGSPNLSDYAPFNAVHYGMLYAQNAENISITGFGNIDGNGDLFFDLIKAKKIEWGGKQYTRQKGNFRKVPDDSIGDVPIVPKERPYQMFIFSNCKRVTMKDITITKPPFWTMLFADCDGVNVEGIRLYTNMLAPNADGIDIASCNNVILSNCDIRSGDDAIAIVGYDHHFEIPGFNHLRHPSGNIDITNCNLQSSSSGIRIGFLDQNSVKNINISNCTITNSTRGIGIFLRDQGSLEDINISNMIIDTRLRTGDWWGNGEPIHISAIRGKDSVKLGTIRNVHFNNIICKGENGILVYGTPESVIQDVTFDHITFDLVDSKLNDVAGGNIDLRGCSDPKKQLFKRNIPGFLARDVNGLVIQDFTLKWTKTRMPFFTNGIEINHFENIRIDHFQGTGSPINPKAHPILLQNGTHATVEGKIDCKEVNVH